VRRRGACDEECEPNLKPVCVYYTSLQDLPRNLLLVAPVLTQLTQCHFLVTANVLSNLPAAVLFRVSSCRYIRVLMCACVRACGRTKPVNTNLLGPVNACT
jgi:hypothetical protein